MKRILCLLLSVVMVLSLAACGAKTPEKPTEPPVVEDTTPDDVEPTVPDDTTEEPEESGTSFYQLKDGLNPVLGPVACEEVEFENADGTKDVVKVSTTPLTFDLDSALLNLRANPFIAEQFPNLYSHHTESNQPKYADDKTQHNFMWDTTYIADGSNGVLPPFKVTVSQWRDYYKSPMSIIVEITMNTADLDQESILSVLRVLYPTEIADYLVYGKDLDNKDINDNPLSNDIDCEEEVVVGDCSYEVERRVFELNGYLSLTYLVGISRNPYVDVMSHAFPGEANLYEVNEFTSENVLSRETYPEVSPFKFDDFSQAFFGDIIEDYNYVRLDNWSYSDYTDTNGVRYSDVNMKFTVYDSNNEREAAFGYLISTTSKDGVISNQKIQIDTWTSKLLKEDVKTHTEYLRPAHAALFDGLTIGDVIVDEEYPNNCSAEAKVTINGLEYTGSFRTHFANTAMMTLDLEYWAPTK